MTEAQLVENGFKDVGLCGTCGNRLRKFTKGDILIKMHVKKDYFTMHKGGRQVDYGSKSKLDTIISELV